MDTDAIVRAQRRQQALESLEFERDRETALLTQVNEVLAELEGPRIDALAFARMEAEDVGFVQEALGVEDAAAEEEWSDQEAPSLAEEARLEREEQESERDRLLELLAECQRRQKALDRYLEALSE